jgi:hypothetical protein
MALKSSTRAILGNRLRIPKSHGYKRSVAATHLKSLSKPGRKATVGRGYSTPADKRI